MHYLLASEQELEFADKINQTDSQERCLIRWPEDAESLETSATWYTWLNDEHMRGVIKLAMSRDATIAPLPHPQAPHTMRGFALSDKTPVSSETRCSLQLDILACNEQIVLNKLVAGKAFSFQPGGHSHSIWQRLKTLAVQLKHIGEYQPRLMRISTANSNAFETAAVGVTITPHALKSNLSKRLLAENYANDGQCYGLVVAPKSLQEMLGYMVTEPLRQNVKQPGFLGILRSTQIQVEARTELPYRIDEMELTSAKLNAHIIEKALKVQLPANNPLVDSGTRHKEIRRIHNLPQAPEAVLALERKPLPWIGHAAMEDFRELYQTLRENAEVSSTYLILMVLSTLLASFGLYANSAPVIIGAMILAPLMAPIISLAMAFARQDEKLLLSSVKTLMIGLAVAMGFAMVLSFVLPLQIETAEISARLRPTLLDLGVAIISGIAGAYASARAQVAKSLAGVAIAVALVPPLAVTGIGLGWFEWHIALGALLLFLTNLAGIVFAAACTFLLMGFAPFSRARKGLMISMLSVILVSIPLAISFSQLSKEAKIVQVIENSIFEQVVIRHIQVISTNKPMTVQLELVADQGSAGLDVNAIKSALEEKLQQPISLEVQWVYRY